MDLASAVAWHGFFQVSQRISATVCRAGSPGVLIGAATPGSPGGYRAGLETGLWIAVGLTVIGAAASVLGRPRA